MKRFLSLITLLGVLLSGCGKKEEAAPPVTETQKATAPTLSREASEGSRMRVYQEVLENFAYEHLFPDGSQVPVDSAFGSMEGNHFAVADVNGDGEEELLISFTAGPMAAMILYVCGYDGDTGSVTVELREFPAVTFYPGGAAAAEMSHNHGMAGDKMWPYTVHTYDPEKGTYLPGASVDGWDRTLGETDYNGEPFPEKVDGDKDGYVYLISRDGATRYLDGGDYEAWRETQGLAAEPLNVEYHAVTRDNIREAFSG